MTLYKGYLRNGKLIKPQNLITGLLAWILFSYILYAFFFSFRETVRSIIPDSWLNKTPILLDKRENYLFNLFYASTASAISLLSIQKFLFSSQSLSRPSRKRLFVRLAINDSQFSQWTFLAAFGRFSSVTAIWYLSFALQYEIDWLNEFGGLLILIPVTIFMSSWPNLRNRVFLNGFKSIILLSVIFIGMSSLFALKSFTNVHKTNERLITHSLEFKYNLKVPRSQSYSIINRPYDAIDIFAVKNPNGTGEPILFVRNMATEVCLSELSKQLEKEKNSYNKYLGSQLIANLHIDRDIKMSFVKNLIQEIRKSKLTFQYSTGVQNSKYPTYYPPFKYVGISPNDIPPYSKELEELLDSLDNLDESTYTLKLIKSPLYRVNDFINSNKIWVAIGTNNIKVNNQILNDEKYEKIIKLFIKKYSPNYSIVLEVEDSTTFDSYIKYNDLIISQVNRLNRRRKTSDSIEYPANIIEWTPEEYRLLEYQN